MSEVKMFSEPVPNVPWQDSCLLYTSDAADE